MKKIFLLVDDDQDDADLFAEAVEELQHLVEYQYVPSARDLFRFLENRQPQSKLAIFLDINMPAVNGWECLAQLKAVDAYKHIPVIIYTTSESPQDAKKATQSGAYGFVTKPDRFKVLVDMLENIAKGSIFNTTEY